jgi:hypothetical protein
MTNLEGCSKMSVQPWPAVSKHRWFLPSRILSFQCRHEQFEIMEPDGWDPNPDDLSCLLEDRNGSSLSQGALS